MSKKSLIAILCIIIVACIYGTIRISSKTVIYRYGLVNSTKEKEQKDTIEEAKNNKMIETITNEINNILNQNNNYNIIKATNTTYNNKISSETYKEPSRNTQIERKTKSETISKKTESNSQEEKQIVKTCINEQFIHGVKLSTFNNSIYNIGKEGKKEIISTKLSVEFDNSNYNGNTRTLVTQAKENNERYSYKISEVYKIVNKYRKECGANELALDKQLSVAASVRALEMAYTNKLSHTRPDGASCFYVLKDLQIDYISAGENIADGFERPQNVCTAWKNSNLHYKNIINSKYSKIGIGIAKGLDGKYYWVQIFSD